MKMRFWMLLGFLAGFSSSAAAQTVNWSTQINEISARENDSALIIVSTPIHPNPSNSTWNCTSNVVHLGVKNSPAPKGMLSMALTAFTTKQSLRIGVRGTGDSCELTYITAR